MGLAREATRLAEKHRDSRWDLLWTAKPAAMERLQRQVGPTASQQPAGSRCKAHGQPADPWPSAAQVLHTRAHSGPAPQAAALQELLGLEALPQDGREARDAARRLGQLVLGSVAPPPLLSQLLAEHLAAMPPVRSRFVDVSTGGLGRRGSSCLVNLPCRANPRAPHPLPPLCQPTKHAPMQRHGSHHQTT